MVSGAFDKLIVSGENIPAEILSDAWLKLFSEYCELIQSEKVQSDVQQLYLHTQLSCNLTVAKLALELLYKRWDEYLAKLLIDRGYFVQEHANNPIAYLQQLKVTEAKIRGKEYELTQLTKLVTQDKEKQHKHTKMDFHKNIADISKAEGFAVDNRDWVVSQYCMYVVRLKEHYASKAGQMAQNEEV